MQTTEITIQSRAQEVITKSGIQLELDVTKLSKLAESARAITSVDDENFKEVKKALGGERKLITEGFMDARREFNRMSKGVIEVQNTILDIFVPEEDRLKALDKAEKERLVTEARLEAMPVRMERLTAIGGEENLPEEWMGTMEDYVETMEDADFELYIVQRQGEKNEADRLALAEAKEKVEADIKKANDELAAKAAEGERIEAARKEERDLAASQLQIEKDKVAADKVKVENDRKQAIQDAADKKAREEVDAEARRVATIKAEEDAKAVAEADRLAAVEAKAANVKYQEWLGDIGYTEEVKDKFKFITLPDGSVDAYKKVGTYKK